MDKVCKKCDVRMVGCDGCDYPYFHKLSGRAMAICLALLAGLLAYLYSTDQLWSFLTSPPM